MSLIIEGDTSVSTLDSLILDGHKGSPVDCPQPTSQLFHDNYDFPEENWWPTKEDGAKEEQGGTASMVELRNGNAHQARV